MDWFMENYPHFETLDISGIEATNTQVLHGGHQLRTLPGLTGTDGFYLASFRRRPESL
jgi:16S rRNA C967 or C1407 C5-methylase (RsmB/RsmF family)